jgi:catechol 2,3-dioxygenase-like lactoylglutathione lyase family enzyme
MSRIQIALNVSDIDTAVEYYSAYFGAMPAKRRPGYANFSIAEPPLKLILVENPDARGEGTAGALNHLGVEVEGTDHVLEATRRLTDLGLVTATEDQTACCFAVQDKVWSHDPDGAPWEIYTVTATSDVGTRTGTAADPRANETRGDPTSTSESADPELHAVPLPSPGERTTTPVDGSTNCCQ